MTAILNTPGLCIAAYDDGTALWTDLRGVWQSTRSARLVVGSALRRQRLLAEEVAAHGTVLGGSIDSIERLWHEVARRCDVPEPVDDVELTACVKEILLEPALPEPLQRVANRPADLGRLVRHLKQIDDTVGDDYAPTNDIERGIEHIRTRLVDLGVVSRARFRTLTAAAAGSVDFGRPLVIAPPSAASPVLGAFLTALACAQPVRLYLATRPADLAGALDDLGLTAGDVTVEQHFSSPPIAPRLRLVAADDEAELAIEEVADLLASGHSAEAIMVATPDRESGDAVVAAARARGIPAVSGWGASVHDSLIGSLLERIANIDTQGHDYELVEEQQRALAEHVDAAFAGLTLLDIQESEEVLRKTESPLEQVRYLHSLGVRLTNGLIDRLGVEPTDIGPQLQQAYLWLDSLQTQIDTLERLEQRGLPVPDAATILRDAVAMPRPRGDAAGIAVVTPRMAPALGAPCVVMTGLAAGTLPRPPATTPFSSAGLLARQPRLGQRDEHPDLSAIVATASSALVMVRSAQSPEGIDLDASAWLNELAAEAAAESGEAVAKTERSIRDSSAPRRRLQSTARSRRLDGGAVSAAIEQLARHRDAGTLPPDLIGKQQSVTTLETYLRCPLGWLVGRYLNPWEPGSPARHMGTVADDAMGAALRLGEGPVVVKAGIEDRVNAAVASMRSNVWYPQIPRNERADLEEWTVRAVRKYFDADYMNSIAPGWRPVSDQERLAMEIDGVRVSGMLDRLDVTDHGVLVIDWKLQRSLALPGREARGHELQRGLYPLMARGLTVNGSTITSDILGFMYVSLAHGDHNGSFTTAVGGGGAVDNGWPNDCRQAQDNAALAIAGIRAGEVWEIGESCRASYCGHHYLSDTAVVRG